MLFDDVRFMPGPLADQLLSVFQKERKPLVVLRDPIAVRIAGRKVYQEGLVIPVGNLASIGVDGSVDFDKNLDLVARFCLEPAALRRAGPDTDPRDRAVRAADPGHAEESQDRRRSVERALEGDRDGPAGQARWKPGVNGLQRLLQGLPAQPFGGLFPPGKPPAPRLDAPARTSPQGSLEVPRTGQAQTPPTAEWPAPDGHAQDLASCAGTASRRKPRQPRRDASRSCRAHEDTANDGGWRP